MVVQDNIGNTFYDDNTRAIKLYASERFIKVGVLREKTKIETGFRSQRIYVMLENEYHNN